MYKVTEYGQLSGEEAMMNEIYARGPISCLMSNTPELMNYRGHDVFVDHTGRMVYDHVISIYGWGVDAHSGEKYWLIRNSFGTQSQDKGQFKIIRGINNMHVEGSCSFGIPSDTWTDDVRNWTKPVTKEEREERTKNISSKDEVSKLVG